jgi:hypothetical protein
MWTGKYIYEYITEYTEHKTKSREGKSKLKPYKWRQFHLFPYGSEPSVEKNKNITGKFMERKLNFWEVSRDVWGQGILKIGLLKN